MKRRLLSLALALLFALSPLSAQAAQTREAAEYYITLNHVGGHGTCLYRNEAHGSGVIGDYFRYGDKVSFPITPDTGWYVGAVTVTDTRTGSEVPSTLEDNTVTFTVTTDCTVTITYRSRVQADIDIVKPGVETLRRAPSILAHPESVVALHDDTVTFSVKAATTPASGELSYQWYMSADGVSFDPVPSVTGRLNARQASLTLPVNFLVGGAGLDGYSFYCEVSNDVSSVDSNVATITVAKTPVITRQPADTTAMSGECAFLVVAEGAGPMTYQWYVISPNAIGKTRAVALTDTKDKISGSQTNDLYLQGLTDEADGSRLYCVVTNMAGSATSQTVTLTVEAQAAGEEPQLPQTPVVTVSPQSVAVAWGSEDVTLTANASVSDGGTLSYQWYYGHSNEPGQKMSGETGRELVITPKGSEMNHYYWCVVTNTKNGQTATAQARCVVTIGAQTPDFNASDWALPELEKADELGLIPDCLKGQDLAKSINRQEFAAICVKVYESLSGEKATPVAVNPFTDCSDAEVLKAYNVGITNGTTATTFSPTVLINREQVATMLTRVYKKCTMPGWTLATDGNFKLEYTPGAKFTDDADIGGFARDSVYFMAANKIVNGYGDGSFRPKAVTEAQKAIGYATATREQALVIAVRLVENLGN